MSGYVSKSVVLPGLAAQSGVVSNVPVSVEFPITAEGSLNLVIRVSVTGSTHVGTQTLKLQTAIGTQYEDSKTATFIADGYVYIKLQAAVSGDQAFLPLLNKGRIVLSQTNAGDVATIASVDVLQAL